MADERRSNGVEVSPEEARFLHRFVRRTMLPWFAGVAALAGLALGVALSPPPPAAEPDGALAAAAQDELRDQISSLREELGALRSGAGPTAQAGSSDAQRMRERADAAERSARSLEARLQDELEPRLAKLEAAMATQPSAVSPQAGGAPSAASPDPLASIRDRLYNLEMRQDRKEQERASLQQDVLARLYQVEQSVQSEADARLGNLQTSEQRIERLELRLSDLEGLAASPASPAPH